MDWSIQEIARLAGTTSRTLRHYGDVGLLEPTRIGTNGYRYYDGDALVRLQRILLLRDLGLGIPAIGDVLESQTQQAIALRVHLGWLTHEQERLDRQIASVERTIRALEEGGELMADEMLDGFDHTQYKEEVEQRWGKKAYADSDRWWRGLSAEDRRTFRDRIAQLGADWIAASEAGADVTGERAQELAQRQYDFIVTGWGGTKPGREAFVGLGEMYVADERFGANYGSAEGAAFVRDAMKVYADRHL